MLKYCSNFLYILNNVFATTRACFAVKTLSTLVENKQPRTHKTLV